MKVDITAQRTSTPARALDVKVAIVTGAGRDIGQACAVSLADRGAAVAVSYHASAGGAEATVGQITSAGGRAMALQADLADPDTAAGFVASLAGRDGGGPGAAAYATSKGALMTMTGGLAKELGPKTRVNALCPGKIDTDFHNVFTQDAVRSKVAAATPLKREGAPHEIGELVAFLATEGAGFINGACIDVNGGVAFS